jgi:hypothetical protein
MAARTPSRTVGTKENLFGFLTQKKVTYHRDVKAERAAMRKQSIEDRKHKLAEKKLADQEARQVERDQAREDKRAEAEEKRRKLEQKKADAADRKIEREWREAGHKNPAVTAAQYRLAQAVLSGTARVSMPRSVAQEIVDRTPAAKRSEFMKANPGPKSYIGHKFSEFEVQYRKSSGDAWGKWSTYAYKRMADDVVKRLRTEGKQARVMVVKRNPGGRVVKVLGFSVREGTKRHADLLAEKKHLDDLKKSETGKGRNPAADAQALSRKFHGRKATTTDRVVEQLHEHKHLMKIGPLVRLVIDTPTGLVAIVDFDVKNPRKVVELATSERDPKTGKLVGKQLYLRGGDQEINLAALKMDSALWIRDKMELGRLHEFKRGERLIVDASGKMRHAKPGERAKADEQEIRGSITYQTRKGMDDFKLINYWHRAGEETSRKYGPAARALVVYDYPNKKIEFVGGQYVVDSPGIIN